MQSKNILNLLWELFSYGVYIYLKCDFLMYSTLSKHSSMWLQLTVHSELETKTEPQNATILFNL